MNIVIVHNAVDTENRPEDADVLVQAEAVLRALAERGHAVTTLAATLDLDTLRCRLQELAPDLVFNLVEALAGTDRLMALVPLLLESMGVKYTGCSAGAILATGDKVTAKEQLRDAGLPTADWYTQGIGPAHDSPFVPGRYIVKPRWEHASQGIDDSSVMEFHHQGLLLDAINRRTQSQRTPFFAERYIHGREFNLGLLVNQGGPVVLPHAEIEFIEYPAEKPQIVGYAAKWEPDSFEYIKTPRRFDFPESDQPLLSRLTRLAIRCWELFELRGYARVDFRIDASGSPFILEVNANPCLAPDAGFAAGLQQAEIRYSEAMARIVDAAL